MEIQPNPNSANVHNAQASRSVARPRKPAAEEVSFAATSNVDRALRELPALRVEVIERAQKLVGDPTYPPRETIHQLSELLAMRLPAD
jgi:hypothetical protein